MGQKNNVLNVYMNDPKRIKSVLEYCLKKKLPDDWTAHCMDDSRFYAVENAKRKISSRERDIYKKVVTEDEKFYLGIENQDDINLIFPWRLMQMDCLAYERQIEEVKKKNRESKVSFEGEDDFLYRFKKEDLLLPVINFVLYWGKRRWKKPLRMRHMINMNGLPDRFKCLVEDYRIHLIDMRAIPESALEEMDSDLKYVLGIMKYEESGRKYQEYIQENQDFFKRIPKCAVDVLKVCMNISEIEKYLEYEKEDGEENVNMCKALMELKMEAMSEGKKESRLLDIQKLMKNLKMSAKQAMDVLEISEREQKEYMKVMGLGINYVE